MRMKFLKFDSVLPGFKTRERDMILPEVIGCTAHELLMSFWSCL